MTVRRAGTALFMGLAAGVLAVVGLGVGQPGGAALLLLALLMGAAGWGMAAGTEWGRYLGILVAIAFGGACAYGVYGLVVLTGYVGISRFNLAVLAVLLLMGLTSVVLLAAMVGPRHAAEGTIGLTPRRRSAFLAIGFLVGVAASVVFSTWLSTMPEPPCCPAVTDQPLIGTRPVFGGG